MDDVPILEVYSGKRAADLSAELNVVDCGELAKKAQARIKLADPAACSLPLAEVDPGRWGWRRRFHDLSRRMASLEGRLGTSLFHRTTRRLSLTETGHAYYERARRILADVAEAEDVARRLQSELRGKLKVAAPMSFGSMHLSPAIAGFLVAHPQLEIELDLNDRHVDLVSEGHDLAIRIGKLPDSSLIARRLAPCRHIVCASPAYLQARGEPRSPECLEGERHDCLVYSNRTISEEWRFRIGGEWHSARVSAKRLGVNNGDVLRDAAIAGLGLVALPTFIVSAAVQRGELKPVLCDFELDDPSIHAVWPPNRALSAKVRAFVDFLSDRFGGTPYWDEASRATP
jgi:DNA-binding transcriptional LysR family regulator